jgi:hypothetical protein
VGFAAMETGDQNSWAPVVADELQNLEGTANQVGMYRIDVDMNANQCLLTLLDLRVGQIKIIRVDFCHMAAKTCLFRPQLSSIKRAVVATRSSPLAMQFYFGDIPIRHTTFRHWTYVPCPMHCLLRCTKASILVIDSDIVLPAAGERCSYVRKSHLPPSSLGLRD